jgi:hypothetical protein
MGDTSVAGLLEEEAKYRVPVSQYAPPQGERGINHSTGCGFFLNPD